MIKIEYDIAHEQSVLIVGKYYSVAHAVLLTKDGKKHYVPINPFKHKDPQFGADFYHYHIDGRFGMTRWALNWFNVIDGKTNMAVSEDEKSFNVTARYKIENIVYRTKRCLRTTTGVKPPVYATSYFKWYNTMVGKKCTGRKCPHFGTVMVEDNGKLVCPMHGLRGDMEKEIIIEN